MDCEINLVDQQRKQSALYLMRVNSFHKTCFNFKSSHTLACICWDRQGVTEQAKEEDPQRGSSNFQKQQFQQKRTRRTVERPE